MGITIWALRGFGMAGVLGALLMVLGDLYYNHKPGSTDTPAVKMSTVSSRRLLTAGTLGLFGIWLYGLASLHVYLAFRSAGALYGFLLAAAFGATMLTYGIAHTAYFSIAAGAQAAMLLGGDAENGGKLGNRFFNRLTLIIYVPVLIFHGMMIYAIVTGKSLYPWWMVLCLPLWIYLLRSVVVWLLRGRARELVNDCYDNFVWLVFFLLSTFVLWQG